MSVSWTNERRQLGDLVPWSRNPRRINKEQAQRLENSFSEFGQVETIAIGPDNEVYNGHQRLAVLMQKYGKNYEIEVRVASRSLTEKEREKLSVFLHKGTIGEWDLDMLANEFEVDDLVDWGFKPYELGIVDAVNDPNAEWKNMPAFQQNDAFGAVNSIIVHFASVEAIEEFSHLVKQTVTVNTRSIWYPEQKAVKRSDYVAHEQDTNSETEITGSIVLPKQLENCESSQQPEQLGGIEEIHES